MTGFRSHRDCELLPDKGEQHEDDTAAVSARQFNLTAVVACKAALRLPCESPSELERRKLILERRQSQGWCGDFAVLLF